MRSPRRPAGRAPAARRGGQPARATVTAAARPRHASCGHPRALEATGPPRPPPRRRSAARGPAALRRGAEPRRARRRGAAAEARGSGQARRQRVDSARISMRYHDLSYDAAHLTEAVLEEALWRRGASSSRRRRGSGPAIGCMLVQLFFEARSGAQAPSAKRDIIKSMNAPGAGRSRRRFFSRALDAA